MMYGALDRKDSSGTVRAHALEKVGELLHLLVDNVGGCGRLPRRDGVPPGFAVFHAYRSRPGFRAPCLVPPLLVTRLDRVHTTLNAVRVLAPAVCSRPFILEAVNGS